MLQRGQILDLTTRGADGEMLWAYRYRVGGRGSKRVQRGGFRSEREARERSSGRFRRYAAKADWRAP
jgi:hypothetical protein